MIWRYWRTNFAVAFDMWRARFRGGVASVIRFLIQAVAVFLLLYLYPWFGTVQDRAKLTVAAAVAVIASGALFYAWDFIAAPAKRHYATRNWAKELENAILEVENSDQAVKGILDRHQSGVRIFRENGEDWLEKMKTWESDFDQYTTQHFTAGFVQQLNIIDSVNYCSIQDGLTTQVHFEAPSNDQRLYFAERLKKIASVTSYADTYYLGNVRGLKIQAMLIRDHGLPEHRSPQQSE